MNDLSSWRPLLHFLEGDNSTKTINFNTGEIKTKEVIPPVAVSVLATAIENSNLHVVDRFNRMQFATDGSVQDYLSKDSALDALGRYCNDVKFGDLPDDHPWYADDSPLYSFGWPADAVPDFTNINPHVATKPIIPPTESDGTIAGKDWRDSAREIADELFDHDTQQNTRDSLDNYSSRVMDAMQARGIHGPRGRIANHNTIKREALQGGAWWANKQK